MKKEEKKKEKQMKAAEEERKREEEYTPVWVAIAVYPPFHHVSNIVSLYPRHSSLSALNFSLRVSTVSLLGAESQLRLSA
jgi:hypothetical protein